MKAVLIFTFLAAASLIFGQTEKDKTSLGTNPNYDNELAKRMGADDYGMKNYFLVILKTGANTSADKALVAESFKGHMTNIKLLVADGKLVVAGPFGKNEKITEVFLF